MKTKEDRKRTFQRLRRQHNLTQFKAAVIFGITENHFRSIETGRSNPDVKLLFRFMKYFNVSAEELLPDLTELDIKHKPNKHVG